jgi:phosphoglycerol transferase MdoB-like AlkP superfamily enzyme
MRIVLALCFQPESPMPASEYLKCFLSGFLRDLLVSVGFSLPLLAWFTLCPQRLFVTRFHHWVWVTAYGLAWAVFGFLLVAEFFFFDEFKSRFNTVAIDYLLYPHEVFVNIWESYPLVAVLTGCLLLAVTTGLIGWWLTRQWWSVPCPRREDAWRFSTAVGLFALLAMTVGLTPNRLSHERLMNELANNSMISVTTAAWSRNLDYAAFYPAMSRDDAFSRTRQMLAEPGATFTSRRDSIARRIAGDASQPRYNVLIFLEESLGSEFFGSLGRKEASLTPELDRLSAEGLLFDNMYATGNRTVRGFEGVLSSFPPLPGDSIVKRDRSENVETIARVLQRDGYRTAFLYGGSGLFDRMRSFSMQNGYERFIEQKDFTDPAFTTAWGVSNEDLYQRVLQECRTMNQFGQPFLATVLSVSNHKPYTYPPGRIPEDPGLRRRNHAVKYTDWALGRFFAAAKKEQFWTNTVFVVVADHGARVYGSQSIPMHSYEIPFLVLGPAVVKEPKRLSQLGSQLDVAPTLLGLLGRPYESMFYGRNLLNDPVPPGRVLLNHNRDIGIARADRMVVFSLNKKIEYYHGSAKEGAMKRVQQPDEIDRELALDGTALFQTADELYMQRRFTLEPPALTGVAPPQLR